MRPCESFQNQLQNILDQVQSGNAAGGATSLTDLGITANTDGSYSTQFDQARQCAERQPVVGREVCSAAPTASPLSSTV